MAVTTTPSTAPARSPSVAKLQRAVITSAEKLEQATRRHMEAIQQLSQALDAAAGATPQTAPRSRNGASSN